MFWDEERKASRHHISGSSLDTPTKASAAVAQLSGDTLQWLA